MNSALGDAARSLDSNERMGQPAPRHPPHPGDQAMRPTEKQISLEDVQRGYDVWAAKPHNAKWVRKIDGTPIANDIVVNIFNELRALSAALAVEAGAVGVKPLEWRRSNRAGSFVAHGAGLMYAADQDHDMVILGKWEGSSVLKSAHDTMEAAQSFAQADYEARIRSALTTSPASSAVEGEAVAWRAKLSHGYAHTSNARQAVEWKKETEVEPLYLHPAPTPAGEWRPVPKDEIVPEAIKGGQVLAYENGRYYNAWLTFEASEGGWFWTDDADSEPNPSHFMPLPASPAPQTEGK